jgi:hypothetical protein
MFGKHWILRTGLALLVLCLGTLGLLLSLAIEGHPAHAQNASSCNAPHSYLVVIEKLTVVNGTIEGTVQNTSQNCSVAIGLATYRKFDNIRAHQQFYDDDTATINPGQTLKLTAALPTCGYQADLFYGPVDFSIPPHYGNRLLDATGTFNNFCVPPPNPCTPTTSTIVSNFNGTPISAGNYIWFNSVFTVHGLSSSPTTIAFNNATIQFSANGNNYNLNVPGGTINFNPAIQMAKTVFDNNHQHWITSLAPGSSGNTFLVGYTFQVPNGGLPGGINPVTWSGQFTTDTQGITIQWQWAAAVYTSFSNDYNAIGVKPIDANQGSQYLNSDHAGTPENEKAYVVGGARGGGGSNWTGSYSGTGSCSA